MRGVYVAFGIAAAFTAGAVFLNGPGGVDSTNYWRAAGPPPPRIIRTLATEREGIATVDTVVGAVSGVVDAADSLEISAEPSGDTDVVEETDVTKEDLDEVDDTGSMFGELAFGEDVAADNRDALRRIVSGELNEPSAQTTVIIQDDEVTIADTTSSTGEVTVEEVVEEEEAVEEEVEVAEEEAEAVEDEEQYEPMPAAAPEPEPEPPSFIFAPTGWVGTSNGEYQGPTYESGPMRGGAFSGGAYSGGATGRWSRDRPVTPPAPQ